MKSTNLNKSSDQLNVNKDIKNIIRILNSINWDFHKSITIPNRIKPFDCRKHHFYPATFRPEIPFTLIEILSKPNARIFDPFGGLGTTYFQTLLLNRIPYMSDINLVSIDFVKNLLNLFKPNLNYNELRNEVLSKLQNYDKKMNYIDVVEDIVLIDLLKPWYSTETFNKLSYLFMMEKNIASKYAKSIIHIINLSLLNAVCAQDRGWGCIADNMLPNEEQLRKIKKPFELYKRKLSLLIKDIKEQMKWIQVGYNNIYDYLEQHNTVFHIDIRKLDSNIHDSYFDIIITSPPYPNMTDYVTSQRLSYYYLGKDIRSKTKFVDFKSEIGARSKRSRKDSLEKYYNEMEESNMIISRKLKNNGYACYVLPLFDKDNSNNSNRKQLLEKMINNMRKFNLVKIAEFERILPSKRRSHNIKWASLNKEIIYLFKKQRG